MSEVCASRKADCDSLAMSDAERPENIDVIALHLG
jgi:hypothetical protein